MPTIDDIIEASFGEADDPQFKLSTKQAKCYYCRDTIRYDGRGWIDRTGGDACSGDDSLRNENHPHTPTRDWRRHTRT